MLLGGLQKAWEAVQNAVNAIVEWIKQQITAVLSPLIEPIYNMINTFIQDLNNVFALIGSKISDKSSCVSLLATDHGTNYEDERNVYIASLLIQIILTSSLLSLLLALSVAFQIIEGILGALKFIPGIGTLGGFVASIVAKTIITTMVLAVTLTFSSTVGEIISAIIPKDSPWWQTALGTTMAGILPIMIQYLYVGLRYHKWLSPGLGDIIGLALALLGFIISYYAKDYPLIGAIVGCLLALIGLIIGISNPFGPSPIENCAPEVGYLDEIVSAGCFGFSLGVLTLQIG
jgi:hypothetical protein